ncbi:MAG: glutamine--tRNA ligase/YqeY domain fusion protein [Acidimicrobiales bacterium]
MTSTEPVAGPDFIREKIITDTATGVFGGRVQTRFPPEPNGYLHIGHAKSILLNFAVAQEFGGRCNLRFDDTNPETENQDYIDGILDDLAWLGCAPAGDVLYASDYFEQLYLWAEDLILAGHAYVDDQDAATISAQRGVFGSPGIESPFRTRPVDENLALFRGMKAGEFEEGSRVLRAKIDMAEDAMVLRDPVMYRIRKAHHVRTGDTWSIYPTYDWAHGQSDAIEGVTHSLCTLEFKNHRRLYDWFLSHLELPYEAPEQTEFARLSLTHTVMSKRLLRTLVDDGLVTGWDDPRMPTLRGLRRRGYPASAIRAFVAKIGVSTTNSVHDIEMLESFVRSDLNATAPRRMAVLQPLKLTITNWPEGQVTMVDAPNNQQDEHAGTRSIPFTGSVWIEQDDFALDPPPKYYRLSIGREVRLRSAFYVTATDVVTAPDGTVVEVLATYDPASEGGSTPDGRKVKATMHWVSADHALDATVYDYGRLFTDEHPSDLTTVNVDSRTARQAKLEPALADLGPGEVVQFERLGFCAKDPVRSWALPSDCWLARRVGQHPEAAESIAASVGLVTIAAPRRRPPGAAQA